LDSRTKKILTVTLAETAIEQKRIPLGRSESTTENGDSVYECIALLLIQSSNSRKDQAARRQNSPWKKGTDRAAFPTVAKI
jgi:hypothetical protein